MAKVRLYGETSGFVDLKAPDVANDVTITLPNATGAFATEPYVDAAVAAIPEIAGIGSNVVSTTVTSGFSSASGTFTDVTGLNVTITPSSATSKVLIIVTIGCSDTSSSSTRIQTRLLRGTTPIGGGTDGIMSIYRPAVAGRPTAGPVISHLDSPETTGSRNYKLQARCAASTTFFLGRENGPVTTEMRITAIEVAP